ncbi:MAG: ATP-binding protein [Lachnospiraceae bacterium]|nr:ATP-binding protein [Lachnospiraceae bacterium]
MVKENPFTITFGKQPNTQISRYEDVDRIISTFNAENAVSQTFLIEGLRGSGKTVLMTTVAKTLAEKKDWIVINLNPSMDLLAGLALRLDDACSKKTDIIKRGFSVSAAGFGVGFDPDEKPSDSVGVIDRLFVKLMKKKKRVLITVDEAVHDENMRIFASQFQIFVRQDYPIFLIMTGMFENIYNIQNDPSLTFLLRSPKITTGPLSILQIIRNYREIYDIDEEEAGELADMTLGYAFAFQALGVSYWDNREKGMNAVLTEYDELLDDFVYKKIWSSLSSLERSIVRGISEREVKVGDLRKKLSIRSGTFSKYRDILIRKGLIDSSRYGFISLMLPRFYEVVRHYR